MQGKTYLNVALAEVVKSSDSVAFFVPCNKVLGSILDYPNDQIFLEVVNVLFNHFWLGIENSLL